MMKRMRSVAAARRVVCYRQQQRSVPPLFLRKGLLLSESSFPRMTLSSMASSPAPSNMMIQPQLNNHGHPSHPPPNSQCMSSLAVEEEWETEDDETEFDHESNLDQNEDKNSSPSSSSAEKHCETCTCDSDDHHHHSHSQPYSPPKHNKDKEEQIVMNQPTLIEVHPCGTPVENNHHLEERTMPPPLPEPKFTFARRVLSSTLFTALDSPEGSRRLVEALSVTKTAASYLPLSSHHANQSDPAYCGVTTLLVVMNALAMDPLIRWRGGWRYFGHEDVLLDRCCFSSTRIQRQGISLSDFAQLAHCHGCHVEMKRPSRTTNNEQQAGVEPAAAASAEEEEETFTLDDFRNDLISVLTTRPTTTEDDSSNSTTTADTMLVVSFSRTALEQTGDGHFSPVAAYHAPTDSVLVLDVARFKYPPYWCSVEELYQAMLPLDAATQKPRGWFLLSSRSSKANKNSLDNADPEGTIPAHLIPSVRQQKQQSSSTSTSSLPNDTDADADAESHCPFQAVKVEYCPARENATAATTTARTG